MSARVPAKFAAENGRQKGICKHAPEEFESRPLACCRSH